MDWSFQVKLEILWHMKRWADTSQKLQPKKKRREKIISDKLVVLLCTKYHFYYTEFESSLADLDCRVILLSFSFPLTQKKYYLLKTVEIKLKLSPSGRNSLEALKLRTSSFLLLYNGTPEISDFLFLFQVSTNHSTGLQLRDQSCAVIVWKTSITTQIICIVVRRW